jgi:heme/copper-type cytochrome/quinol oxidase subunit 3
LGKLTDLTFCGLTGFLVLASVCFTNCQQCGQTWHQQQHNAGTLIASSLLTTFVGGPVNGVGTIDRVPGLCTGEPSSSIFYLCDGPVRCISLGGLWFMLLVAIQVVVNNNVQDFANGGVCILALLWYGEFCSLLLRT